MHSAVAVKSGESLSRSRQQEYQAKQMDKSNAGPTAPSPLASQ